MDITKQLSHQVIGKGGDSFVGELPGMKLILIIMFEVIIIYVPDFLSFRYLHVL